jgi:predicted dehydrogenase
MRLAVFGLGFMGSTHLKAWRNIPAASLFAVMDEDQQRLTGDLSSIQGNIGGPGEKLDFTHIRKYTSVKDAVADPEIEIVDICLPTDQHVSAAVAALRAGKHVLVEKPLALDAAGADQVMAEARKSGRLLMTGQVVRFIPSYRIPADMLKSGKLGPVRSALFRRRCAAPDWSKWLTDPSKSGGGVFDLLIHDVDYCLHIFGPPTSVSAVGYEDMPHGIDWISARLYYPSIGAVIINGGWHHPKAYPFSMEFTIVADGGTFEYSSAGRPLTLYGANGEAQALETPEKDFFQEELEYFMDCVTNGHRPERCLPEESAAAVKLTRWMVESRGKNGERIECRF